MAKELTVKPLVIDDIPTIIELARELHAEVEKEWPECPPFNPALVEQQIFQCMYVNILFAFGLFASEKCVGMIVFTVYPCFGIGCVLGKEAMWYVQPEYRSNGLQLLTAFEKMAKEKGAAQLEIGHFPMVNGDRMAKLYAGLGYKLHQIRYLK